MLLAFLVYILILDILATKTFTSDPTFIDEPGYGGTPYFLMFALPLFNLLTLRYYPCRKYLLLYYVGFAFYLILG
jgi:hypothetical protein